jgi:hypothetical protein
MPQSRRTLVTLLATTLLLGTRLAAAEALFTLSDGGKTFLYRARPGAHPSAVAEMFGIPPRDVPAFLAANGISDPTRVGAGFVYRVPNAAVSALTEQVTTLGADNARLKRADDEGRAENGRLARAAEEARAARAVAEERVARDARLERLWPWVQIVLILLLALAAGALYTAVAAMRRRSEAERYARALANELEEKRRATLGERQESARRILDLEQRVRSLEAQLGPKVVIGGRSGS